MGKIEQIYDNKKQNNMLSELNDISVRDSTTDRWQYHFTVKLISEIEKDQKLKLHQWYLSVINENNIQYRINSSFINCIISIHFSFLLRNICSIFSSLLVFLCEPI